jgi:uncharacterized membrane protein (UPF0127 family)
VTAEAPRRFRRLPRAVIAGRTVPVATTRLARLAGLAGLSRSQAGAGLLIPRCRSVHTVGMRFALDLVFLDGAGRPVATRAGVVPLRVASEPTARAVLEVPAAEATR